MAQQPQNEPRLRVAWQINEAAASLGISREFIYKLARSNKLQLVRIGRRTVIPDAEVRRLASGVSA